MSDHTTTPASATRSTDILTTRLIPGILTGG
jgi:hypothetical protein